MKWPAVAAAIAAAHALAGWVIDHNTGIVCDYVRGTPENPGNIRLRPTYLTSTSVAYIAVAEAKFRDVGLPSPRQYHYRYSEEQSRVKLPWSEVQVFGDHRGVLSETNPEVVISVEESGKWCVYTGYSPTAIAVEFINDYGALSYSHYWLYQVTFGSTILLVVIYGILKLTTASTTAIGQITTSTISLLMLLSLIQIGWWFVANNWLGAGAGVPENQRIWVWLGQLTAQALGSLANAIGLCGLWQVARGVGTRYYANGDAAIVHQKRLTTSTWYMKAFVLVSVVSSTALAVVHPRNHPIHGDQGQDLPYTMMARGTALLLHRVVWLTAIIVVITSYIQSFKAISPHSPLKLPMHQSRALVVPLVISAAIAATNDPWHQPSTTYFAKSAYIWSFVVPAFLKITIILGVIAVWIIPKRGLRQPLTVTTSLPASPKIVDPPKPDGSRSAKEAARQAALARFERARLTPTTP
ncbi:hypothetical protein DIURU_003011 [Diutina rugosa]|uniref:Uncharacterized protein n=1 Tax=Diutina rugosa TaxID=5481 RepID=A0A642UMU3_DIURU|nr:uncharacterized protein DIURU_003011 [Diutina rugosa]KAA8901960.1 hypothetical protein DIURU_003011 [Diutina rugosa]